jgi:uncharacterized protein YegP (UPF0339 family)
MERLELYRDEAEEWRWRRIAENGNVLSDSGEGYARRIDALEMGMKLNPNVYVSIEERREE